MEALSTPRVGSNPGSPLGFMTSCVAPQTAGSGPSAGHRNSPGSQGGRGSGGPTSSPQFKIITSFASATLLLCVYVCFVCVCVNTGDVWSFRSEEGREGGLRVYLSISSILYTDHIDHHNLHRSYRTPAPFCFLFRGMQSGLFKWAFLVGLVLSIRPEEGTPPRTVKPPVHPMR